MTNKEENQISQDELRRKYGFTSKDIEDLRRKRSHEKAYERIMKERLPKSEFVAYAKKQESINERCKNAIVDRVINEGNEILLLDGKPLKECGSQVKKAFLIQSLIKHRWIWNKNSDLIPSNDKVTDISEFNDDTLEYGKNFSPSIPYFEWRRQCKIPKPIKPNDKIVNPWNN